jgi:hypothetical protein
VDIRTNYCYLGDNYALTLGYTPSTTVTFATAAYAYAPANSAAYLNGVNTASDSTHTVPFDLSIVLLGNIDRVAGWNQSPSPANETGNSYNLNGWMKKWTYWPLRLTNAELAEITET